MIDRQYKRLTQKQIVQLLLRMLDNIAVNAGYPRYLQNESVLIDHEIYFDICQIIFPELNIKLIKIQEYHGLNSTQKLQYLIDLLAQELHIDLSYISGNAIMNYDLEHIHKFLDLLLQYSMKYMEDKNPNRKRVNSDPPKDNSEDVSRNLHSARGPGSRKEDDYYLSRTKIDHEKEEEQQDYLKSTKRKKKQTQYSVKAKRARSEKQMRSNIHEGVVQIIRDEKSNAMMASLRDNRKDKDVDIKRVKTKYKSFLVNYKKDNIARKNHKGWLENIAEPRPTRRSRQLPLEDFDRIQRMFESFSHKFRDCKAAYLRKMKELIRKQQADRQLYNNRILRETRILFDNQMEKEMTAEEHQHKIRKGELKEKASMIDGSIELKKKEYKKRSAEEKKIMRDAKKRQIARFENQFRQKNEKVLMELQEGGRLQRIIMGFYKNC